MQRLSSLLWMAAGGALIASTWIPAGQWNAWLPDRLLLAIDMQWESAAASDEMARRLCEASFEPRLLFDEALRGESEARRVETWIGYFYAYYPPDPVEWTYLDRAPIQVRVNRQVASAETPVDVDAVAYVGVATECMLRLDVHSRVRASWRGGSGPWSVWPLAMSGLRPGGIVEIPEHAESPMHLDCEIGVFDEGGAFRKLRTVEPAPVIIRTPAPPWQFASTISGEVLRGGLELHLDRASEGTQFYLSGSVSEALGGVIGDGYVPLRVDFLVDDHWVGNHYLRVHQNECDVRGSWLTPKQVGQARAVTVRLSASAALGRASGTILGHAIRLEETVLMVLPVEEYRGE